MSGDGCALVVNGSVWYGCAYGDGSVAWDVAYGAVEIVAGREERTILGIGVVASCLLALSLWPGVETVVDITNFSEVVLEVVGGFSSNLDWERMVYGFCYLSLLFLYFSFKIINVHNTFEGFVWGFIKNDYLCSSFDEKLGAKIRTTPEAVLSASGVYFSNYAFICIIIQHLHVWTFSFRLNKCNIHFGIPYC